MILAQTDLSPICCNSDDTIKVSYNGKEIISHQVKQQYVFNRVVISNEAKLCGMTNVLSVSLGKVDE